MRYDAENLSPSRLMSLVQLVTKENERATRRDLRPHRTTVTYSPNDFMNADRGEFALSVDFEAGRATIRSHRGDPATFIPDAFREDFEHEFEAQPLQ